MLRSFAIRVVRFNRLQKQAILAASDIVLLLAAAYLAYALRLNTVFSPDIRQLAIICTLPIIGLPIFMRMGLYRSVIRYIGEQAMWTTVRAVSLLAVLWALVGFLAIGPSGSFGMPRSVPFLFWALALIGIGGSRFMARWLLRLPGQRAVQGRPVLIYGAGEAGAMLINSLANSSDLSPVGFLDEDPRVQGTDVAGLRTHSPDRLGQLIEHYGVRDVIVCLPNSTAEERMAAVNRLEGHGLDIRILPPLADIASGRHLVNLVREVEITDLLGREPVAPVKDLLSRCIENKTVLVTGAGGSIGSALSRTVARLSPKKLILLDASEPALYQIDRKLRDEIPEVEVVAAIGSVRDKSLVRKLIRDHGIETIYHAAAHKHVPLVESNIAEAVHNNILGTRNMVELALVENVETFVLVSTDKAVRPTNVMGATKRWAELVVQDADARARKAAKGQRFSAVRFGNVLGSSGSVIPLFKEQIARGGPVTVTHPEVTRYFMSVEEAVALIIQAGSMASGGEVFLLEMGEPVRIQDLARKMIEVSGHRVKDEANPNGDIEISIAGLRPGEKLYEELLVSGDGIEQTDHPRIMRSREPSTSSAKLKDLLAAVDRDLESDDSAAARALLLEIANSNLQPESKAQQSADI